MREEDNVPNVTCVGDSTKGICDLGIYGCCGHSRSGTNNEGSPLLKINEKPVHLVSHTGPANCPHGGIFESIEGTTLLKVNGIPVTLVGHKTVCRTCGKEGTHVTGSNLLQVEA